MLSTHVAQRYVKIARGVLSRIIGSNMRKRANATKCVLRRRRAWGSNLRRMRKDIVNKNNEAKYSGRRL